MTGTEYGAVITALFLGVGTLLTAIVTACLQVAAFRRAGRQEAALAAMHAVTLGIQKNTDGLMSAAAEVAKAAAERSVSDRDKDRASAERTVSAALAATARGPEGPPPGNTVVENVEQMQTGRVLVPQADRPHAVTPPAKRVPRPRK